MSRRRFVTEVYTVALDQSSYFRKVCFFLDKVCVNVQLVNVIIQTMVKVKRYVRESGWN